MYCNLIWDPELLVPQVLKPSEEQISIAIYDKYRSSCPVTVYATELRVFVTYLKLHGQLIHYKAEGVCYIPHYKTEGVCYIP